MATEFTAEQEHELEQRDDRVRDRLMDIIDHYRLEADDLEQTARERRAEIKRITSAVRAGHYWELKGMLTAADIESLCNIEPSTADDRQTFLRKA